MKKYIYIFILTPLLILSCDYSPIYSNKNNYDYEIQMPNNKSLIKKSYAENFTKKIR